MITLQQNILLTYFISYFYNSRLQATATGSGDMEGLRHGCRTPGIFVLFLLFFTQKIKEKEFDRFVMQYDLVGNMLRKEDRQKNLVKDMSFDSYNRVRQVTNATTSEVLGNYTYDDQGFRVQKTAVKQLTVNGSPEKRTNHILYPNKYFGMERQYDAGGTEIPDTYNVVNNIYLNGVRIASVIPNGAGVYYMTDQVDSVKVVTDDNGEALSRMEYMPYGELWFQESLSIQSANGSLGDQVKFDFNPKYNSQELDKESNFYFYNARHYDPELARFITPDTVIDGQNSAFGWNRYMYVHGNPIMYKDPTGHFSKKGIIGKKIEGTMQKLSVAVSIETVDAKDTLVKLAERRVKSLTARKVKTNFKIEMANILAWNPQLAKNPDSIKKGSRIITDVDVMIGKTSLYKILNKLPTFTGTVGACGAVGSGRDAGACGSVNFKINLAKGGTVTYESSVGGGTGTKGGFISVGIETGKPPKTSISGGANHIGVEATMGTEGSSVRLTLSSTKKYLVVMRSTGVIKLDSANYYDSDSSLLNQKVNAYMRKIRASYLNVGSENNPHVEKSNFK